MNHAVLKRLKQTTSHAVRKSLKHHVQSRKACKPDNTNNITHSAEKQANPTTQTTSHAVLKSLHPKQIKQPNDLCNLRRAKQGKTKPSTSSPIPVHGQILMMLMMMVIMMMMTLLTCLASRET